MLITVSVLASSTLVHKSFGQTYCALRNPSRVIYEEFPEADGHRSIIRTASIEDRAYIATVLPFTLDFNELGRHTLYVPLKKGVPLGLIHVRTETGLSGLTEVAWSLTLDGKIKNVSLQRCRDNEVYEIVSDKKLFPKIEGADISTLLRILNDEGLSDASRLLLESAAKTIAVTLLLWQDDIMPARASLRAAATWPESNPILNPAVITLKSLPPSSGIHTKSIRIWTVTSGANGEELGSIVRLLWKIDDHEAELWWAIDQHSKIVNVEIFEPNDASIKDAFREVIGLDLEKMDECATSAGVTAGAVLDALHRTIEPMPTP